MQNLDDTITLEVKSRLNDLFGETTHGGGDTLVRGRQADSPLKELKSAVLSIDWEITDEGMDELLQQVGKLQRHYADERIALLFLQLLGSIGKYIQINKHKSHPEAFRILNTVFGRFEEVVNSPNLDEAHKKRYLYAEIVKFKKLKEKIAHERGRSASAKPTPKAPEKESRRAADVKQAATEVAPETEPPEETRYAAGEEAIFFAEPVTVVPKPDVERPAPYMTPAQKPPPEPAPASGPAEENLAEALEEIKQLIRQEFEILRKEMRLLVRHRA